jgi:hypothetical protein
MWEDRKEHIGHFKNVLKKNGIQGKINLVKQFVKEPAGRPDDMKESLLKESYTAVVLDKKSIQSIMNRMSGQLPTGWEVNPHHMTIDMKPLPELKGQSVDLVATTIGHGDKTIALGVKGYKVKSGIPHITVAVDKKNGGKPRMSKDIKKWTSIKPIKLKGVVDFG